MLYDLNFLAQGKQFPPQEEIKRLDAYRVNTLLVEDEPYAAMPAYKQRIIALLNNFSLEDKNVYLYSANYWQDLVRKMQELTFGEAPVITAGELAGPDNEKLQEMLKATELNDKMREGVSDFVSLGDYVTKIVDNGEHKTFIVVDPATWFPVVSRENEKEVRYHVFCWIINAGKDRYELHAQIHEKGKYTNLAFAIKSYNRDSYFSDRVTGQRIQMPTYEIGAPILGGKTVDGFEIGTYNTGLDDFAVIHSANNPRCRSLFGTSDFDKITEAVMEYNVRMTLKGTVLDKHSTPKMYGPALTGDNMVGNYIEVGDGATAPNYLVWDASMQSVEKTIEELKDDIASLSEMGSVMNDKTFGESQGYDALMIKLTPAIMRTNGVKATLEKHMIKLISLLGKQYGLTDTDITVTWHGGIPVTESVRADIAQKHLSSGWSTKRVLMVDYGMTEEEADKEIQQKQSETPSMPFFGESDDVNDEEESEE